MYLDRMDEMKGENEAFLESHPAVQQMCSDFLVHLLHRKPDDVVAEAKSFFTQYVRICPHRCFPPLSPLTFSTSSQMENIPGAILHFLFN
jgi:hypothetical protein